jgi:tripartite-type tricarboxylate transporter receptor subunit TctC
VHLASELFLSMAAGCAPTTSPSAAPRGDARRAGRARADDLDVAGGALPYLQRGELRALAISTRARSPLAPEVPTFIEGGVANYEAYTWHMALAPAGTPPAAIRAANSAFNRALANTALRTRLTEQAMEVVPDSTPDSAAAFLAAEIAKWEPIIRARGIKAG